MAQLVNKGLLGEGGFGKVYLMENQRGEQFAVKEMKWWGAEESAQMAILNELKILNELAHERVICYMGHVCKKDFMYIVMEYCSGGDLNDFLKAAGRPVPEDLLKVWLSQMACGLEYMHTKETGPVLHRDLKPSNVLLTESGNVCLGDVGIARQLETADDMAKTWCGTPPYMSPEVLQGKSYNSKTDIWSLGCCVVEMATLKRAYDGCTQSFPDKPNPLPDDYSRDLDRLLSLMLEKDFQKRISATEILNSSLLKDCGRVDPMGLLKKHNLMGALASSTSAAPHKGKTVMDDKKITLNEEAMRKYRIKVASRMRGRRQ